MARRSAPSTPGVAAPFQCSLLQAKKKQSRVREYRQMFLVWRARRVITYAGYILGFPG
jgi:hypothetical protein